MTTRRRDQIVKTTNRRHADEPAHNLAIDFLDLRE